MESFHFSSILRQCDLSSFLTRITLGMFADVEGSTSAANAVLAAPMRQQTIIRKYGHSLRPQELEGILYTKEHNVQLSQAKCSSMTQLDLTLLSL